MVKLAEKKKSKEVKPIIVELDEDTHTELDYLKQLLEDNLRIAKSLDMNYGVILTNVLIKSGYGGFQIIPDGGNPVRSDGTVHLVPGPKADVKDTKEEKK